ncbi:MAG: hypothetical protein LBM77_06675 [Spirochaetaceae bacterium]|nr:hypothetical protein [Spirochaetaceae bacterium]
MLSAINKTFPLKPKHRAELPKNIYHLSNLLTRERGERRLSYMNDKALLSAYIYCFLPWNVFRLTQILPALDLSLHPGDAINDLGSGPLTLPIALWLNRPDLQAIPLEFRCIDISASALNAGKQLFDTLSGNKSPWKITTIRGDKSTVIKGRKPALISAVNVFNEAYLETHGNRRVRLEEAARHAARGLAAAEQIFVMEPGTPPASAFISALHDELLEAGFQPSAPCTHKEFCPLKDGNQWQQGSHWCHFSWEVESAPLELQKLNIEAGLRKDKVTAAYLYVKLTANHANHANMIRVLSNIFSLQNNEEMGRYACCEQGLVLLAGTQEQMMQAPWGTFVHAKPSGNHDKKTGAAVYRLI